MSKLQVDTIVDKEDKSAPTFSKGVIVTGVTTASGGVIGNVTGTLTGTASGLAGSPDITVGAVASTNETVSKQLTVEHATATGIITATGFVDDGTNLMTEIDTKATTGKAIAMAMVFG